VGQALPQPDAGTEAEVEIRQVFEAEDFGVELTPELREQEERPARAGRQARAGSADPERRSTMATIPWRLHRVLRAPAERIYRAFLDAGAMANGCRRTVSPARFTIWTPGPRHLQMVVHQLHHGHSHSFGGEYLRARANDASATRTSSTNPNLPGEMQTTVS